MQFTRPLQGVASSVGCASQYLPEDSLSARIELLNADVARVVGTLAPSSNGLLAISPATNIAGDKEFVGGEVLTVWGGQLEAGVNATSFIQTASTALSRAADQAGLIGLNGTYDVHITYDDDTETALSNVQISDGWWPTSLSRSHVKRLIVL
ncbi:phage head spike fiber domain-containing protein [Celeribacter persicus]|uniref:phage head spike fiber domain-containing protein n=1 Tax=Celeribacter persicus TaxID=1651082 RepID=UPI0011B22427|nr:hypothetical protein [Celeribacter persicus]